MNENRYEVAVIGGGPAGSLCALRLAHFGRQPEGLRDFHVFHAASCPSEKAESEPFSLRLADFETSVIGEILQVSLPEKSYS